MGTVSAWLHQLKDDMPEMKNAIEKFESSFSEQGFDETRLNSGLEKELSQIETDLKNSLKEQSHAETKAH